MEEKEVEQFDNNLNIGKVNIIIADDEVKDLSQWHRIFIYFGIIIPLVLQN